MKKTIWAECKNYSVESEKIQEINLDRFNPEIHRKLFWKNFLRDWKEYLKWDFIKIINHPWMLVVWGGLLGAIFTCLFTC